MQAHERSTWKGALAGLAAGIVGTWAMTECQALWSRAVGGYESTSAGGRQDAREWQERYDHGANANEFAADAVGRTALDRPLRRDEKAVAAPLLHYAFGSGVSAAYGAVTEHAPAATAGYGTGFGLVVWAGADETLMPLLGWSRPWRYPPEAHLQALAAHLVFGWTTEWTRRMVRQALR